MRPFNTTGRLAVLDAVGLDEDDADAAARLIRRHARDDADAQFLLEACGIVPTQRDKFQTYSYGRVNQA